MHPHTKHSGKVHWLLPASLVFCGLVLLIGLFFPVYGNPKRSAVRSASMSNAKQLGLGLIMYASDHNDRLGGRDTWMDYVQPYVRSETLLRCPQYHSAKEDEETVDHYGFAFFSKLAYLDTRKIQEHSKVPFVYSSLNFARNASDPFISLPRYVDGGSRRNVCHLDGHTRHVSKAREEELRKQIAREPALRGK